MFRGSLIEASLRLVNLVHKPFGLVHRFTARNRQLPDDIVS
ncbi:MAG: hypothetical protein RBQ80_07885 [Methanocorpusculum sp.]|nr:hypothetical protein [Methanocorpusculum sp.]